MGKEDSGKEYFFLAIMAELKKESGILKRNGKVVYLDMDNPKFLKGTIRTNITLGQEFFIEKFKEICRIVKLKLKKYPGRDLTEMVEGQRNIATDDIKKILLARMLYLDPDIILINKYFD